MNKPNNFVKFGKKLHIDTLIKTKAFIELLQLNTDKGQDRPAALVTIHESCINITLLPVAKN